MSAEPLDLLAGSLLRVVFLGAGRELDDIIAEKVMGESVCHQPHDGRPCHMLEAGGGHVQWYSTDIVAAWTVVEKMMESRATMFSINGDHERGRWCVFVLADGSSCDSGTCETIPLAICRAALLATEFGL